MKYKETIGKRFGHIVVLGKAGSEKCGEPMMDCLCDCGKLFTRQASKFWPHIDSSCGCSPAKPRLVHGHHLRTGDSPTYISWKAMKKRCLDKTNKNYKYYGGRGVAVCVDWMDS